MDSQGMADLQTVIMALLQIRTNLYIFVHNLSSSQCQQILITPMANRMHRSTTKIPHSYHITSPKWLSLYDLPEVLKRQ